MGQSASTVSRSYKAAEAAGKAASARIQSNHVAGAVAVDAERAAQNTRRAALSLEEEEQQEAKDEALGHLLDRIGGAIHGRSVNIYPKDNLVVSTPSSAGRLPAQALKDLFELQQKAQAGTMDMSYFVTKYNADPALLQKVLATACLPDLVEAKGSAGVEAFAEYPVWFSRRR